jgi:hypothetical protein
MIYSSVQPTFFSRESGAMALTYITSIAAFTCTLDFEVAKENML